MYRTNVRDRRGSGVAFVRTAATIAAVALAYSVAELFCLEILRYAAAEAAFIATPPAFTLSALLLFVAAMTAAGLAILRLQRAFGTTYGAAELALLCVLSAILLQALVHVHLSVLPMIGVTVALITVTAAAARDPRVPRVPAWVAALLIVLPDWIANDYFVRSTRGTRLIMFAVTVLMVAALCMAGVYGARRMFSVRTRRAIATSAAMAVIGLALLLRQPVARDEPASGPVPSRTAPNVLLITLDTVRADHLSLYGYARDTTPFLRSFARTATVYTRALAPSNMTLSTHASLLTGLPASQHGAHFVGDDDEGRPLPRRFPTLAENFRRRGYAVSAIAANWAYFSPEFGLDRGFSYYSAEPPARAGASLDYYSRRQTPWGVTRKSHLLRYSAWWLLSHKLKLWDEHRDRWTADEVNAAAQRRFERPGSRPFFVFLNYFDAHGPYRAPAPYDRRFPPPTRSLVDHWQSQYDGSIAYLDSALQRLFQSLRDANAFDRTLIIVTSDHGESFYEHGTTGHGTTAYDEEVRVPLIVKLPGQRSGAVVDDAVALADVFGLASVGRAPIGAGDVVTEAFPLVSTPATTSQRAQSGRAIIRGQFKLIQPSRGGGAKLYDLASDPREMRDIAADQPVKAAELKAALADWVKRHPAPHFAAPPPISDEIKARLRALGYLK